MNACRRWRIASAFAECSNIIARMIVLRPVEDARVANPARRAARWDRLVAWLRERLPRCASRHRTSGSGSESSQFPGGHSNLTYLVRFGDVGDRGQTRRRSARCRRRRTTWRANIRWLAADASRVSACAATVRALRRPRASSARSSTRWSDDVVWSSGPRNRRRSQTPGGTSPCQRGARRYACPSSRNRISRDGVARARPDRRDLSSGRCVGGRIAGIGSKTTPLPEMDAIGGMARRAHCRPIRRRRRSCTATSSSTT